MIEPVKDVQPAPEALLRGEHGRIVDGAELRLPLHVGLADPAGDQAAELLLRDDDKPETVQHRLEVYHAETEPLKDFYAQRGILKPVENQPTIEETNVLVMKALEA